MPRLFNFKINVKSALFFLGCPQFDQLGTQRFSRSFIYQSYCFDKFLSEYPSFHSHLYFRYFMPLQEFMPLPIKTDEYWICSLIWCGFLNWRQKGVSWTA